MDPDKIEPMQLTRRRFLQASTLFGSALAAPQGSKLLQQPARATSADDAWPLRVAFCSSSAPATPEATESLVRRLLAHSPPVVVAFATPRWHGGARAMADREHALHRAGARTLLIHHSLDLTETGKVRDVMHAAAHAGHVDGWRFDFSVASVDPRDRRIDIALETASRMARRVIWIALGHGSFLVRSLAERAAANPGLRFVLETSADALHAGRRRVDNSTATLLRLPNVAVRLNASELLTPRGLQIMKLTGPDRLVWGIQDLSFRSVSLDPLVLMAKLGEQTGQSVLARWAVEAYALRAHHYH